MASAKFRTLIRLAVEYALITLPIIIYVTLEAIHQQEFAYLLRSPEWSIATIFLSFQTVRLFLERMERSRGPFIGIALVTLLVILISAASVNAYMGLESGADAQSWSLLTTKWLLLVGATVFFVCFGGAAIWAEEAPENA